MPEKKDSYVSWLGENLIASSESFEKNLNNLLQIESNKIGQVLDSLKPETVGSSKDDLMKINSTLDETLTLVKKIEEVLRKKVIVGLYALNYDSIKNRPLISSRIFQDSNIITSHTQEKPDNSQTQIEVKPVKKTKKPTGSTKTPLDANSLKNIANALAEESSSNSLSPDVDIKFEDTIEISINAISDINTNIDTQDSPRDVETSKDAEPEINDTLSSEEKSLIESFHYFKNYYRI